MLQVRNYLLAFQGRQVSGSGPSVIQLANQLAKKPRSLVMYSLY